MQTSTPPGPGHKEALVRNFPSKGGGEPQLTLSGTLRAYLCHQGSGDGG